MLKSQDVIDLAKSIGEKYQGKSSLIPVWGTLADVAASKLDEIPSVASVLRFLMQSPDVPERLKQALVPLAQSGDYVTALTLLSQELDDFDVLIDEVFPDDWQYNVRNDIDDMYHIFVSAGFDLVASTDIDSVLELAFDGEEQLSYDSRNLSGGRRRRQKRR